MRTEPLSIEMEVSLWLGTVKSTHITLQAIAKKLGRQWWLCQRWLEEEGKLVTKQKKGKHLISVEDAAWLCAESSHRKRVLRKRKRPPAERPPVAKAVKSTYPDGFTAIAQLHGKNAEDYAFDILAEHVKCIRGLLGCNG